MNVCMAGGEFHPFSSGGNGTDCYGQTKAMRRRGMNLTYVMPIARQAGCASYIKMSGDEGHLERCSHSEFQPVRFRTISSCLRPYASCGAGETSRHEKKCTEASLWQSHFAEQAGHYGGDIFEQVRRYADKSGEISTVRMIERGKLRDIAGEERDFAG